MSTVWNRVTSLGAKRRGRPPVATIGRTLDQALEATLRSEGVPREFRRGQALFVEGDRAERLVIIDQGWVLISCVSPAGRETVLSLAGPGDLLGEVSAVDDQPRSATATALTDTRGLVVPASALTAALQHPEVAAALLRLLAGRLREADRKRIEFANLDTLGRVATRLVELAERFGHRDGGTWTVALPLSQEQLASWCAASRESTVKALATLRSLGCLATARHTVVIHDIDTLTRYSRTFR